MCVNAHVYISDIYIERGILRKAVYRKLMSLTIGSSTIIEHAFIESLYQTKMSKDSAVCLLNEMRYYHQHQGLKFKPQVKTSILNANFQGRYAL